MATQQFPVAASAPSTTLDADAVYRLLERVLAVQERLVEALGRLAPPASDAGCISRPVLRVVR